MKRSFVAFASRAVLSLSLVAGCGGGDASSEDASGDVQDLTAAQIAGYFQLSGDANNDDWIEAIALHADATFEANMGSDVSNLSGHHFPATGTFAVEQSGGKSVLALTFAGGGTPSRWDLEVHGDTLRVKPHATAGAAQFTMQKTKLVTLTFGADWSATASGPLAQGDALLIRYAAARDTCAPPPKGGLFVAALGQTDGGVVTGLTGGFGSKPVKGFLGALGFVPNGKDLAIWFETGSVDESGGTKCSNWDSKFGKNFHFPISR